MAHFRSFFHTAAWTLLRGRIPDQLVIQFTDHCNARCPQCGMRVSNPFSRRTLDMDDVKRMIDAAARQGIRVISFTGGEPLLHLNELTGLIRHAGDAGIDYIRTGTNGFFFARPECPGFMSRVHRVAEALAETPLRNLWMPSLSTPATGTPIRAVTGALKTWDVSGTWTSGG